MKTKHGSLVEGKILPSGGSFARPLRCSSVTAPCGDAPSSRLADGQNLSPRHLLPFMRWLPGLFTLKLQRAVLGADLDMVAGLQPAVEQLHCQRIQQEFLDGPLQRASAELRIVTLLREKFFSGLVQFDAEILERKAFFQSLQLHFDDGGELLLVEIVEDDDVIHAVQELG